MLLLRQSGVMPFPRLVRLSGEFDRLFASLTNLPINGSQGGWMPPMEVRETESAVTVTLEVPGLTADEVEVTVDQEQLTITGEKRSSTEQNTGRSWTSERRFGRFTRVLSLPKGVRVDQIRADHRNGVLEITMPKAPEAQPRRIPIGGSESGKASGGN